MDLIFVAIKEQRRETVHIVKKTASQLIKYVPDNLLTYFQIFNPSDILNVEPFNLVQMEQWAC